MGLFKSMMGEGALSVTFGHLRHILRATGLAAMLTGVAACQTIGTPPPTDAVAGREQAALNGVDQSLWKSALDAERASRYDQAVGALGNLYQRHASDPRVVAALVRNLRYNSQAEAAVELVERGATDLLSDPDLKFEYAKALLASGRIQQALPAFRDLTQVMADNWQLHSAIGIAFDALGQYPEAISAYQTALQLSPNNPVVMNNLAMSQAMSGQLQAAIGTLETAAGFNRTNPHIRQNLALLYAVNGEEEKAKALAAMDLSTRDLETNLSFYRRFGGAIP